jgi:hypothetical protein
MSDPKLKVTVKKKGFVVTVKPIIQSTPPVTVTLGKTGSSKVINGTGT